MNNLDTMVGKTVSWVDQIFSFVTKYGDLFVYGFVAMMIAKMAKFNFKIGGK